MRNQKLRETETCSEPHSLKEAEPKHSLFKLQILYIPSALSFLFSPLLHCLPDFLYIFALAIGLLAVSSQQLSSFWAGVSFKLELLFSQASLSRPSGHPAFPQTRCDGL